jgi:molybdopterin converting factor small subunit
VVNFEEFRIISEIIVDMSITIRVTGIFLGDPLNKTLVQEFKAGDTSRKLLKRLDKEKALGRKFFASTLKSSRATFLLNGDRIEIPEMLDDPLTDGDEISVLSAIAGG